jgi:hypothetical protein
LRKKVKAGELVYGSLVTYQGIPTHKCLTCQTKFTPGQRTATVLSSARLASSFVLAIFVGYYAGSATIVGDPIVKSTISQLLSASITPSTAVTDLAMWILCMFVAIGLLAIGSIAKNKMIVSGGLGYVAGFLSSAWILNAWWTMMFEAAILILFLVSYAILSE